MLTRPKIQAKIPSHSGDRILGESKLYALPAEHEHGDRDKISYLIHYNNLLQNATDVITKRDSYFITKCDEVYFKNRQVFITKRDSVITKCDSYYKMRVITYCDSTLCHGCFPVNFAKFLRKRFLQNTSGRLLLKVIITDVSNIIGIGYSIIIIK